MSHMLIMLVMAALIVIPGWMLYNYGRDRSKETKRFKDIYLIVVACIWVCIIYYCCTRKDSGRTRYGDGDGRFDLEEQVDENLYRQPYAR